MTDPPPAPAAPPPPLPAKRRRGRPRKDGKNLSREGSLQSMETSSSSLPKKTHMREEEPMIGNAVHGVIEGCFDAGYLISVTIDTDSSATPYRGVVFHPTKTVPVTPSNDPAPPAAMPEPQEEREREPDTTQFHPSNLMILGSNSGCYVGVDKQSLRMVEEDEVMQVFEVSSCRKIDMNTSTDADINNSEICEEHTESLSGKQDTKFQGDLQEIMARSIFETKQQRVPVIDLHQNHPFVSHGNDASDHFQNGCDLNIGHDYSIKRGIQQSENPLFLTTFMEEDHIDFREKPRSSPPNNIIMDTDEIRLELQCGIDRNIGSEATNSQATAHHDGAAMNIDLDGSS
ncbi:hypothetical protein M569_10606 [Genlisea aurea]|uniref:Uncharacterized protein n=1 Tax=Genlisea aurea TaxID=192259 RepID=S8CB64_9LAMI|nr:hypothetical protein M569_10606 [Genlisea aurea]